MEKLKKGLTTQEAEKSLAENGKNALREEKPKTIFQMFLEQMLNFTNFILLAAIIISVILGDVGEACIIGVIIIANAIIGVVQEGKAQKALDALKKLSVLKAHVIRDGEIVEISSEDIVVGDYVLIEAGQQVPADIRLTESINLKIDEKALTGESVAIEKDCNFVPSEDSGVGDMLNLAYMTTVVTYGRGAGEVIATGMNTEVGKIADMINSETSSPSPLQKAMADLSKILGIVSVIICALMFLIGVFQQRDLLEMLMTSVSLAVAAIPEGIPTIVTIVLALGMQRMAKINAIVKKLPAVETLGAVNYVCSDKTGTLTQNKMTVVKGYTDGKYIDIKNIPNDLFLEGFLLCNDAVIGDDGSEIGDPTETALVQMALNCGIKKKDKEAFMPRIGELPFDSDRKLMTTMHQIRADKEDCTISFTKGSTDAILSRCSKIMIYGKIRDMTLDDIDAINSAMSSMSLEALRVLSLACRYYQYKDGDDIVPIEQGLIYIGMVGMIDPERPEVKDSISVFKRAGVKTIMITGDHKDTAFAIAKNLGIAQSIDECISGNELNKLSDSELENIVLKTSVFARVSPEHKVRIVKALQANGNIVSMTGDGTNDSPSLKAADVGVAMGITGTDVAKGAADIVLQDDSFVTIEKAIREGRNIYENIKKSILFALSSNVSEVITMFCSVVVGLAAPLKAVQILWVNLLTDSAPCFALGVDPNSSSNVMDKKPRKKSESLFSKGGLFITIFYSVVISLITLGAFLFVPVSQMISNGEAISITAIANMMSQNPEIFARSSTYSFCILAISELFHAIGMRDIYSSVFKFNHLDNKVMIFAVIFGILMQVLVTEVPFLINVFGTVGLSFIEWLGIIFVSAIPLLFHEILVPFFKKKKAAS